MLTHHAHVALALGMLVIAGINAWLMLESFGGRTPKTASRRRAALHRWLGRTYLAVYVLLLVSMLSMALDRDELSAVEAVHGALGLALLPLLFVKILIVRRYPPLQSSLPLLGSLVLVLTFVTVGHGPARRSVERCLALRRGHRRSAGAAGQGAVRPVLRAVPCPRAPPQPRTARATRRGAMAPTHRGDAAAGRLPRTLGLDARGGASPSRASSWPLARAARVTSARNPLPVGMAMTTTVAVVVGEGGEEAATTDRAPFSRASAFAHGEDSASGTEAPTSLASGWSFRGSVAAYSAYARNSRGRRPTPPRR